MLLNCILLALSVSIDSLGIGISYGIKHTKISKISNFTLFSISFIVTSLSINYWKYHFFHTFRKIFCITWFSLFNAFRFLWNL